MCSSKHWTPHFAVIANVNSPLYLFLHFCLSEHLALCPGGFDYKDHKIYIIEQSEDGKKLLGAVLVGDTEDYDTLLQYSLNAIDLPEMPESLILPSIDGNKPTLGADALPDDAIICSCLKKFKLC